MLRAGTNAVTGKRALAVHGDPRGAEFDDQRLFEQATHMGVPKVILENYLDRLRNSGRSPGAGLFSHSNGILSNCCWTQGDAHTIHKAFEKT